MQIKLLFLSKNYRFFLSPNITRIAFFCALTGLNLEGLAPPQTDTPYER